MSGDFEQIKTLPDFRHKVLSCTPLEGGLNNKIYKVSADGGCYAVKFFDNPQAARLSASAQQAAFNTKIAPQVFTVTNNVMISEFVQSSTLASTQYTTATKIRILAELVATLHQIDNAKIKGLMPINISQVISHLFEPKLFTDTEASLVKQAIEVLSKIDISSAHQVFIHGDVNFNNVLVLPNGNNLIIDFESSAIAPIEYELAMIMAVNLVPTEQLNLLVNEYLKFNQDIENISISLVMRYVIVAAIINGLWYKRQAIIRQEKTYQEYAIAQFNYAKTLSSDL